jgi:hypothetical protein
MAPTTGAQNLEEVDIKVTNLSEHMVVCMTSLSQQFQYSLIMGMDSLKKEFHEFVTLIKGKHIESYSKEPHSSRSPWGFPKS